MTNPHWIAGPRSLEGASPFRLGGSTHHHIVRAWLTAASIVAGSGVVIFGFGALEVIAGAVCGALVTEAVVSLVARRRLADHWLRAALTGVLLALTLPATTSWAIAVFGSVVAILVGHGVFEGSLHPALIGRVVTQAAFSGLLGSVSFSPVLTPGHLLVGNLDDAARIDNYRGWIESAEDAGDHDAYLLERPVKSLRKFAQNRIKPDGDLLYTPLIRDVLPPWSDTIFGVVPGGIGETCTVMIVVVGIYLIHRGFLRWQLPLTLLGSAALVVSILPVQTGDHYHWFPALEIEQGRAVGLSYVLYHLTSGQLVLTAFLLAGDVIASPMRAHGQVIYAAFIGAICIFMRLYGVLEGECYWSVLIMNMFVGTIDRHLRRPVLGMEPPED